MNPKNIFRYCLHLEAKKSLSMQGVFFNCILFKKNPSPNN
nr:MAG TPA: hypothetical protein [Caudoviricetes sp.]